MTLRRVASMSLDTVSSIQSSRSSSFKLYGLVGGGSGLYADFAFGAVKQAGNVLAVHEPKRRGQK